MVERSPQTALRLQQVLAPDVRRAREVRHQDHGQVELAAAQAVLDLHPVALHGLELDQRQLPAHRADDLGQHVFGHGVGDGDLHPSLDRGHRVARLLHRRIERVQHVLRVPKKALALHGQP
ncbi:hypothetical protein D9M68_872530 [compost metagenome]